MLMFIFCALLLSFLVSFLLGNLIVPFLKKHHVWQSVSRHLNIRHLVKDKTPTMGGLIFILSVTVILAILLFLEKISFTSNLYLILFVFYAYAVLGFIDDFLKIKYHDNKGLSVSTKFIYQIIISVIFFSIFLIIGGSTTISFFHFDIDLKYFYGIFILFLLVGASNAVNITDGLDGLAAGCAMLSFMTLGIIALEKTYVVGNIQIALFCFLLSGSLLGFLFYNFYPAKVFMGDLGSLALGASLSVITIILKCELLLVLIGIVYILETLCVMIQIFSIKILNKKIFLKSPLHHHYEEKGLKETEIIKLFYMINLIFCLLTLIVVAT